MEPYLRDKRDELVWALDLQGYTFAQIVRIFSSINHRNSAKQIIERRPTDWKPKWIKQP